MDKIWYRKSGIENPSKTEVIGRCGGYEKNEWPRRTDKSRPLKKIKMDDWSNYKFCLPVAETKISLHDVEHVNVTALNSSRGESRPADP